MNILGAPQPHRLFLNVCVINEIFVSVSVSAVSVSASVSGQCHISVL